MRVVLGILGQRRVNKELATQLRRDKRGSKEERERETKEDIERGDRKDEGKEEEWLKSDLQKRETTIGVTRAPWELQSQAPQKLN